MSDQNIEILRKETYLKFIQNSIGSKSFNSLFVKYKDTGNIKDVLEDGTFSCAFFVSGVLFLFQIIEKPVATVKSLRELIDKNDKWKKILVDEMENGDVIFWNKTAHDDGTETEHVGFVVNKDEAVSTNYKTKNISKHPSQYRNINVVYRYSW